MDSLIPRCSSVCLFHSGQVLEPSVAKILTSLTYKPVTQGQRDNNNATHQRRAEKVFVFDSFPGSKRNISVILDHVENIKIFFRNDTPSRLCEFQVLKVFKKKSVLVLKGGGSGYPFFLFFFHLGGQYHTNVCWGNLLIPPIPSLPCVLVPPLFFASFWPLIYCNVSLKSGKLSPGG